MGEAKRRAASGDAGTVSGELPNRLASDIVKTIAKSVAAGMDADAAACVAAQAVADFAALGIGDDYAIGLGRVIEARIKSRDHAKRVRRFEQAFPGTQHSWPRP